MVILGFVSPSPMPNALTIFVSSAVVISVVIAHFCRYVDFVVLWDDHSISRVSNGVGERSRELHEYRQFKAILIVSCAISCSDFTCLME